jgi:hypothetical protein
VSQTQNESAPQTPTTEEPTPTTSSTSDVPPPPLFAPSRSRGRRQLSPALEAEQLTPPGDDSVTVPEQPSPVEEPSSARRGSERSRPFAGKAAVTEAVATGLKIGTGVASERFAPPEAPGMFELLPEDEQRLVPPLAGLASRRVPETMAGSPDLTDAIAGAMALALYVGRQLETWRAVRRMRKAQAGLAEPLRQDEAAAMGAPDLTGQ